MKQYSSLLPHLQVAKVGANPSLGLLQVAVNLRSKTFMVFAALDLQVG